MKTIVRLVCGLFFSVRPGLAPPSADRRFVALAGFADRALRAPVERPQDFPDVACVVVDAEFVGDQTSDARAGPQRRRETVGLGALQQQRLEALELSSVQKRLASGTPGLAQPRRTVPAVLPQPLTDGLPRDLQPPRRFGLIVSVVEQPHRFEAALLQRLEIPPSAFLLPHT